jgi:hypothetical protein
MMKTEDTKLPADRRCGRYSNEFKRALVKACEALGLSTASVALSNGVNANILRRWASEFRAPSTTPNVIEHFVAPDLPSLPIIHAVFPGFPGPTGSITHYYGWARSQAATS